MEETTKFALWMQEHAGPIDWQMLRTAFLQEQFRSGGKGPELLPTMHPALSTLLVHEFEMLRLAGGCRLLLVPDQLLMPGRLYRFSFWLDLEDHYVTPTVEVCCGIPRANFFLFSQSHRSRKRLGFGRLSYFVAVPEPTFWAMLLLLQECAPELAMFRGEQRSERRARKRGRRRRHATRRERGLV